MKFKFPKLRIGAHVVYYAVGFTLTVGSALLFAKVFGQSEEDKVAMLKAKVRLLFIIILLQFHFFLHNKIC